MSSDIGYLQNKIRELQDEVSKIKLENEIVNNSLNSMLLKIKQTISDEYLLINNKNAQDIKLIILEIFKEELKAEKQEGYNNLHETITKELLEVRKGNRDLLLKYIEEIVYQRKDLGNVLSILVKKGITTTEEIAKLDKLMLNEIKKSNVKEHIFNMFYPILTSPGKSKLIQINHNENKMS